MRSLASIILLMSLAIQFAHSDKILVISFFSSKSHKITYMRLIEELASRGHQITVVSPVKAAKEIKNIKQIHTFDIDADMSKNFDPFKKKEEGGIPNPFTMLEELGVFDICRRSYDLPQVKQLLKEDFDMVFIQPIFNDCTLGIAYRLKAPLVLFLPISVPTFMANKIGGYFPASFVPNGALEFTDEMNLLQRFTNFGINVFMDGLFRFYYEPQMAAIYREKLGDDIPGVTEILGNASLILSNGHFSLNKPKPYLPDIVDVGGIHSIPAGPLPKDLEDFVSQSGKDGFILFSMGSAIKGNMMPEEKRKMFLNVFSKLKQRVIWKWESEMSDLPKNVKLSKWLPQQDLLGDPNIKLFITHCGGGGTEEAIYHGVPLVGIPMFGDQNTNAKLAKNHGYLVQVDWIDLTEESLMAAIQEILNNKKYRENVQRLSKVFKDQVDDPLQRGVFWVEYVLRHKGAPQLRSASRKLNVIQYHSLDVIALYLAIIFTVLYITFASLRFILSKVCGVGGSSKSSKSNQSKQKKKQ